MAILISSRLQRLRKAGLPLLLLVGMGGACLFAEIPVSKEYQVKAVYLFNFAQFVKWPSNAFTRPDEPFCIGILGQDPFDAFLDETVHGEKVDGHPLVIRRCNNAEEAKGCQILFISGSESPRMEAVLGGLKGRNILTVGDTEDFIKDGGIVRFITKGNKIHFRISPEAAKRAKLVISSKVLRLAEIAKPGQD